MIDLRFSTVLDYWLWPSLVIVPTGLAWVLFDQKINHSMMAALIIVVLAIVIRILEHVRPERLEHNAWDQPVWMEAGHGVCAIVGHTAALGIALCLALKIRSEGVFLIWPVHWPLALQFFLALLLHESLSYWQHRLFHHVPFFWKFHALHHSGTLLNSLRTPRFHFIDALISTFFSYLPLSLIFAPEKIMVVLGVFLGATGILQHANIRFRTFFWMDMMTCTPILHRRHHSSRSVESHCNFGNSVMLFDVLFGTFIRANPEGPEYIGIEEDFVPRGFLQQIIYPFKGKNRV